MPDRTESLESILQRAETAKQQSTNVQTTGDERLKEIEASDRSWALQYIISRTFWAVFLVLGFLIVASWQNWSDWEKIASIMFEILKIVALPLATFVLGQYFGSTRK